MPVWYEATKRWVAQDKLVFIGITQEQHPDRCELYRQWKQFDFPILWDPFNLTDSKVVPRFIAIDEYGIVRSTRPSPRNFEKEFLQVKFDAPAKKVKLDVAGGACSFTDLHGEPSPISLLSQHQKLDESVEALRKLANENPSDAKAAFHAGVALRMRYDSALARPDDFQAAIDAWTHALKLDPNQYIWRRRIQQYGPRMDKPYPFYTWTTHAREEVLARGETPVPLVAELTAAELAQPRRAMPASAGVLQEPDPDYKINADKAQLISIESAVAFDTSGKRAVASVHLTLRPNTKLKAHWNHESGPAVEVWIDAPTPRLLRSAGRDDLATSDGLQLLNFEIELADGENELVLPAYALYYVCEGQTGKCLYLRQEFEIEVRKP